MTARSILWLTIWAMPAFAALLALGTWQVHRLHWKRALIAERASALAAPPVALPDNGEAARGLAFHRVEVTGVFLHDREFHVNATERRSGRAGLLVVTPLLLGDGSALLVERGWVPRDRAKPESRAAGEIVGLVRVEGLLRLPAAPGWFVPDNRPDRNEWYSIDLTAMAETLRPLRVRPFYLEAGPAANPGGYPLGGQAATELPNDHLQYAVTWYSLALALAVIYLVYVLRARVRRN